MKAIVLSDSHGKRKMIDAALNQVKDYDMCIHLGDIGDDETYLEGASRKPTFIVAGNNDIYSGLPDHLIVSFGTHKMFLNHGHYFGVYFSRDRLAKQAYDLECDIALYGHTHIARVEEIGGITVLNPGSLAYPRGDGGESFAVLELDREGKLHYNIHKLEATRKKWFF